MPSNILELDRDLGAAVHQGLPVPHLQAIIRKKGISLQAEAEKLMLLAAYSSRIDVLLWLLRAEVTLSPYAVDDRGSSILDIAVGNEDDALVHWIMSNESIDSFRMLSLRNGFHATPLEAAIQSKNKKLLWSLVHDVERIPFSSEEFRKIWLRLLDSESGEVLDVLHLPWREYQLRDIWDSYETEHVEKDELEDKLQHCQWWPLFVDESVWNDRERSCLESAMRRGAAKGDVETVRWLAEDWGIDVNVVNNSARDDLQGFLTLADCAVHGTTQWSRRDDSKTRMGCCWAMAHAVTQWDGRDAKDLVSRIKGTIATLEQSFVLTAAERNEQAVVEMSKELNSLREERAAECGALLDFLLDSFGRGAMPRLDLVVLTGRVKVLEILKRNGRLQLRNQIVIHTEQNDDASKQVEECAVCFGELKSSVSFPCKHRFCHSCHFDLRVSMKPGEAPLCPLCRAPVPAWSEDLESLVVKHLRATCGWLVPLLEPGMTIADVLAAVAAHRGMLSVISWLHSNGVRMTARFGGRNLMHLAASGGHYALVKWLCSNGMKHLAAEKSHDGRAPVHEAALAGDRSTVLFLIGERMAENDGAGRSVRWYCRQSPNDDLKRDARASARVQYLSSELPRLLAHNAPLEYFTKLLQDGGLAEDAYQLDDLREKQGLCRLLVDLCRHGRSDVLRWLYVNAGLQWVKGLESTQCRGDPEVAAPVFTVAEAFEAVQEDCQSANAVIEVMSEVETVKDAAVQCQALFDVFQSKFEQGAPAQELLRLATEQDAAVARVPADFRRYFSHLRVALSACNDIRLEALLCQAAELGHAHLAQWMLLDPRLDISDEIVVQALGKSITSGRLSTAQVSHLAEIQPEYKPIGTFEAVQALKSGGQVFLEEALRLGVDVCRLQIHRKAEPGNHVSVVGLAIQGAVQATATRAQSLELLQWLISCPEVELAVSDGRTALEELATCVQVLRSAAASGKEAASPRKGMGRRPRRKKQVEEEVAARRSLGVENTHEDVLDVLVKAGLEYTRRGRSRKAHAPAVKMLAECGNMVLVRRLAIVEGVNIQAVQPYWDILRLWYETADAIALVETWKEIRKQQQLMFELADDILRGAVGIFPERLHCVSHGLENLRDRHGRTVLAGAKADGCLPALEWLARRGVSE